MIQLSEIFGQGSNSDVIILIGILLALLQIYAILRPNPALHKQYADKDSTSKDLQEIKKLLQDEAKSGKEDRRIIYNRLNRHDGALWFLTGRLDRKGNQDRGRMDADQLRKILTAEDDTNE